MALGLRLVTTLQMVLIIPLEVGSTCQYPALMGQLALEVVTGGQSLAVVALLGAVCRVVEDFTVELMVE